MKPPDSQSPPKKDKLAPFQMAEQVWELLRWNKAFRSEAEKFLKLGGDEQLRELKNPRLDFATVALQWTLRPAYYPARERLPDGSTSRRLGLLRIPVTGTITRIGRTATFAAHQNHGLATGGTATIHGAAQQEYNGTFKVTVSNATVFSYTVKRVAASPATGSPALNRNSPVAGPVIVLKPGERPPTQDLLLSCDLRWNETPARFRGAFTSALRPYISWWTGEAPRVEAVNAGRLVKFVCRAQRLIHRPPTHRIARKALEFALLELRTTLGRWSSCDLLLAFPPVIYDANRLDEELVQVTRRHLAVIERKKHSDDLTHGGLLGAPAAWRDFLAVKDTAKNDRQGRTKFSGAGADKSNVKKHHDAIARLIPMVYPKWLLRPAGLRLPTESP